LKGSSLINDLTPENRDNNVIEANIITGKNIGNKVYIPRMSLSPS